MRVTGHTYNCFELMYTDDDKQSVVNEYSEVKDMLPGHYCNIKLLIYKY